MKRSELNLLLTVAGIVAAYYFYTKSGAQLNAFASQFRPLVLPPARPLDPRTLPGYQPGPDPIRWPDPVPLGGVVPVDPINRPGVVIDPSTGDPGIVTLDDPGVDLSSLGIVSYDY